MKTTPKSMVTKRVVLGERRQGKRIYRDSWVHEKAVCESTRLFRCASKNPEEIRGFVSTAGATNRDHWTLSETNSVACPRLLAPAPNRHLAGTSRELSLFKESATRGLTGPAFRVAVGDDGLDVSPRNCRRAIPGLCVNIRPFFARENTSFHTTRSAQVVITGLSTIAPQPKKSRSFRTFVPVAFRTFG